MKWSRSAFFAVIAAVALHGELSQYLQHLTAGSPYQGIFFKTVTLPAGAVPSRRPPRETVAELSKAIGANPQAELFYLRARENEQAMDYPAAEADWKKYADVAADKFEGLVALADYHHRRLQVREELQALASARALPSPATGKFTPEVEQRSWKMFQRSVALIEAQGLPAEQSIAVYREWANRYPRNTGLIEFLRRQGRYAEAAAALAEYEKKYPDQTHYVLTTRAALARSQTGTGQAIGIYESSFQPLWPPQIVASYFALLKDTQGLRQYLANARAAVETNPLDVGSASRLFYYYQQQGNVAGAQRALQEYRLRKRQKNSALTSEEALVLAQLFESMQAYGDAVELYSGVGTERALASTIHVLFTASHQSIRLGAGDLSYYQDVATADPYPGAWNGLLSLLFNSTYPREKFAQQDALSAAYFHRAKAVELLAEFDRKYPSSAQRAELHAELIGAYSAYGEDDGVLREGRVFLAAFPKAEQRVAVAMNMADSHARKGQSQQEYALYDSMLQELANAAEGMPLGPFPRQPDLPMPNAQEQRSEPPSRPLPARSMQYQQVLERYISRLVSDKKVREALAVYRKEIDRNPQDPGLYERLAQFLNQNKLAADLEQLYLRAAQQFDDRSWYHKLARWYLRQKQTAKVDAITRDVVSVFTGTELETYFREVVEGRNLDPQLYRQVNLYAHQKFPHDLVFVKNLLVVYRRKETYDEAAWEQLVRSYWYYDNDLRSRFFEHLSRTKLLDAEIRSLTANPVVLGDRAGAQMLAEAQIWASRFETAAPVMRILSANYPADQDLGRRAASLFRSIENPEVAASIEMRLASASPRDTGLLERAGEVYAEKEQFAKARAVWDKIPAAEPGKSDGYLKAATVYWDYFQFDDALRMIHEARQRLNNPALFAFEAAAIHENRRDYEQALTEYRKGAVVNSGPAPERARLIRLARRPALRDRIEALTASEVSTPNGLALRAALLESQNRLSDLETALRPIVARGSAEMLNQVDEIASRQGFAAVRESVLQRRVDLAADPVEKTRFLLELAKFQENRPDLPAAARTMQALYQAQPRILGVVRETADFYWRTKNGIRAIDVLERAAADANSTYKRSFRLEAARKATELGDFRRARRDLDSLLAAEPLASDLVAAMAGTYLREGKDAGLRTFYTDKLNELRQAPLSQEEKTEKMAALRRGMIPVLTRQKDFAGAVEQYIQVLNAYPEDAALAQEAAAFARNNGRTDQLRAFYAKASADSPRDFRWPLILARVQTAFEDLPAAVDAYTRASSIRPDRVDVRTSLASLQERLFRFDAAGQGYEKLYQLTYRNPQWMVKLAATKARQGQTEAAVAALKQALLDGRAPKAADYFEVARKLEAWGMLPQALDFAGQGFKRLAGRDPENNASAQFYVYVAARVRSYESSYIAAEKVVEPAVRVSLLNEIAKVAAEYYTPEEKTAFAAFLPKSLVGAADQATAAEIAGLEDVAVRTLAGALARNPRNRGILTRLVEKQRRRLHLEEAAQQVEEVWRATPVNAEDRSSLLEQAAQLYREAGLTAQEMRVLSTPGSISPAALDRVSQLVLTRAPEQLVTRAQAQWKEERNAAARAAVEGNSPVLAFRVISARGAGLTPVWTKAYTALAALWFGRPSPEGNSAFQAMLGSAVIGDQLGRPVDREQQLAGANWFYYGSRYGEYLGLSKDAAAEDYLPAVLEEAAGNADAYITLADYYREAGAWDRAIADYEHALQFQPYRGEVQGSVAEALWAQGKQAEARARWQLAIQTFHEEQERGRVPETFWKDLQLTLENAGTHGALQGARADIDKLIRTYIRRNGSYRVGPLLRGLLGAAGDRAGTEWIIDLASVSSDPVQFLSMVAGFDWFPSGHRDRLYERLLTMADNQVLKTRGAAQEEARRALARVRMEYASSLVDAKQGAKALAVLDRLDSASRVELTYQIVPLEIRASAESGKLEDLFARYRSVREKKPALESLLQVAADLRKSGDMASAHKVLAFAYSTELDEFRLSATNFLGLAEVRLEEGDVSAAVALLRRLNLVAGEAFENLDASAALLEKTGHAKEATEFREQLGKAAPWDKQNALRLAVAHDDTTAVLRLVKDNTIAYEARVAGADAVRKLQPGAKGLGAGELDVIAQTNISPAAAAQPYFYFARLRAADQAAANEAKFDLLRGAIGISPNKQEPRIPLFRAGFPLNRISIALAALQPYLQANGIWQRIGQDGMSEAPQDNADARIDWMANGFLWQTALGVQDRADIARGLGSVLRRLGRPNSALLLYGIARQLDPKSVSDAEVQSIQAQLQVALANQRRKPLIREQLEQDWPVRPRLVTPLRGGAQ